MKTILDNRVDQKVKEAQALIKRFNQGTQTPEDEKLVAPYAFGKDTWHQAVQRYVDNLKKSKEQQLSMFIDNGLMFGFADDNTAAPVQILRGSLFSPIARGRRKVLTRHPVANFDGGELVYSGVQLDQADLDVMLLLTRLLSDSTSTGNVSKIKDENGRHEYSRIKFSRYSFLKQLKRSTDSKTYRWFEDSLRRLTGELEVNIKHKGKIAGSIIGKRAIDEQTGMMMVDINHDYVKLFGDLGFSFLKLSERLELNSGFSKWLHAFVSTHRGKSTYSAEKLMELSSSKTKRTRDFMRQTATPAFESLANAGTIKWFKLDGHLYHWHR